MNFYLQMKLLYCTTGHQFKAEAALTTWCVYGARAITSCKTTAAWLYRSWVKGTLRIFIAWSNCQKQQNKMGLLFQGEKNTRRKWNDAATNRKKWLVNYLFNGAKQFVGKFCEGPLLIPWCTRDHLIKITIQECGFQAQIPSQQVPRRLTVVHQIAPNRQQLEGTLLNPTSTSLQLNIHHFTMAYTTHRKWTIFLSHSLVGTRRTMFPSCHKKSIYISKFQLKSWSLYA